MPTPFETDPRQVILTRDESSLCADAAEALGGPAALGRTAGIRSDVTTCRAIARNPVAALTAKALIDTAERIVRGRGKRR
jgi:hypothetical protein